MSIGFESSTSQLNVNDGITFKRRNSKLLRCFALIVVLLLILFIVFLAMYVRTDDEKNIIAAENEALKARISNVETTALPTSQEPATTSQQPTTPKIDPSLPYANVRLPQTIFPEHYDVNLNVYMNNRTVDGYVNITVTVKKPTKYFIIHAYNYTEVNGYLKNSMKQYMKTKKQFLYVPNQYYVIEVDEDVEPGTFYLDFEFLYTLKKSLKGFYQSTYRNKENEEKLVASTQFQPVSARIAFPCFDEPAMRANFSMKITHTPGYFALANMPNTTYRYLPERDMIYNEFKTTPSMPTYLVAFAVCDFGSKTITANTRTPTKMTFYAPKDQVEQLNYAMKVGKSVIEYFETYYNVSYPLPKADMIAIPDFAAGAMENWGLITYRTTALLFDEKASSTSNKLRVATVVAHELAHQWFGNIVTMEWWSDLWLNEGFASYVEYIGMNSSEPTWNIIDFQVINDMASGLGLDSLVSSHPIYIPVEHPSEIDEIFDSISYSKGGSVLRMLDHFLSTDVFVKGLTRYLKKYSYGNANTKDLFDTLTKVSFENGDNLNVTKIMDSWVKQMGFPVVTVTIDDNTKKVGLTQERFYKAIKPDLTKSKFNSSYNYKWYIPFYYVILDISDINDIKTVEANQTWLNLGNGEINYLPSLNLSNMVIKGNNDQYGFYRVNYQEQTWDNIANILMNNHKAFSVKDRAGILSDAFALAESGRLNYCTAIKLFDYIDKEEEYLPWKTAVDGISIISSGLTKTKPAKKYYKKFMLEKVTNLFEKLQFNKISDDMLTEKYLRNSIASLACGSDHKGCLDNATKMFRQWREDDKPVPPDFRNLVYYYGVYYGGVEEWDFVFDKYLKSQIASEKIKLLYALAGTRESWLLDRYLNYGLNDSIIKQQDVSYIFSYVANYNPNGRYLAWSFMKDNWNVIEERFVESFFTMRRIFSSVTSGFSTTYELEQVKEFVKNRVTNPGSAKQIIKQSEERIKSRISWIDTNEKTIEKCLKDQLGL